MHESRIFPAFLAFLLSMGPLSALAAESGAEPDAPAVAEEAVTAVVEARADAAEAEQRIPDTLEHEEQAVTAMDQPLDGSSVDAFNEGLARVEQEVSPQDYQRLESAIKKLLFYDTSARGKREMLYKRLNGKTPNQIIEQSRRR